MEPAGSHIKCAKVAAAHGSPGSSMEDLEDARLRARSVFKALVSQPELPFVPCIR